MGSASPSCSLLTTPAWSSFAASRPPSPTAGSSSRSTAQPTRPGAARRRREPQRRLRQHSRGALRQSTRRPHDARDHHRRRLADSSYKARQRREAGGERTDPQPGSNLLVVRADLSGALQTSPAATAKQSKDDAQALHERFPLSRGPCRCCTATFRWCTEGSTGLDDHSTAPRPRIQARDWQIAAGRNLTEEVVSSGAKVWGWCNRGTLTLFADTDPLGATCRIQHSRHHGREAHSQRPEGVRARTRMTSSSCLCKTAGRESRSERPRTRGRWRRFLSRIRPTRMPSTSRRTPVVLPRSPSSAAAGGRRRVESKREERSADRQASAVPGTAGRRRGVGLAGGRRHRDHEHHARLGGRADA